MYVSRKVGTSSGGQTELAGLVKQLYDQLPSRRYEEMAKRCGVIYLRSRERKEEGRFIVNVLNKTYTVELDTRIVVDLLTGKQVPDQLSYVILEYLLTGDGSPLTDTWTPYTKTLTSQDLASYLQKAVIRPLVKMFGFRLEAYEQVCRALGGRREKLGGHSFSFLMLPKVRLLCQLWTGDKREMTLPEANILHSSSATKYLKPRGLVYAFETLVFFLEREAMKLGVRK